MTDVYSIGEMVIDFIPGSEPASYIRKAGAPRLMLRLRWPRTDWKPVCAARWGMMISAISS